MQKRLIVMLAVLFVFTAISSAIVQGAEPAINGKAVVAGDAAPAALACQIKTNTGMTTTVVKRSNPWTYVVNPYWISFGGGPAWKTATVTILVNNIGLPEQRIVQHFSLPAAYSGGTVTPFALTGWNGAANNGTGRVIIDTSDGMRSTIAVCNFTIAPF